MTFQEVPASRRRSPRTVVTLLVATLGLSLNLRASILLGPHLHEYFDLTPAGYAALIGLPLLVAALVRLPVGVLTDRYGARVMFPAVSLLAAASAVGLALADSFAAVVIAGAAAGVAGAAFVVGATLVSRISPYGGRGRALGTFGVGAALATALSALSWAFDPGGRRAALVLGALLVGFAGLAALVLPGGDRPGGTGSPAGKCAEMTRLASSTSLTLLYAVALGGIVSFAVYLPIYLTTALALEWFPALVITGVVVALAALGRLAGGWWTDRRPTSGLLTGCYAVAAGLCIVGALAPRAWWLAAPIIAGVAVCDGIASGVLLALIGKAARPESVGSVMGTTGAAGSLGSLLPPLLLAAVSGLEHSYAIAWSLVAAVMLAAALYVRSRGLHIGLGLAVHFEPEPSPTAMTVAVVGQSEVRLGAAAVVARLAELATSDELVVVYEADERARRTVSGDALAAGLRDRLPRHSVVAVPVARDHHTLGRDAMLLGEYVDAGTLAIAVTPTGDLRTVAADLSLYLHADRMLLVSYTPAEGAALRQV